MPTKQELHKLIDELPDNLTEGQLEGVRRVIQAVTDNVDDFGLWRGAAVTSNKEDTATLTGLSSSALMRDWDSEADSIYDDD